MYWWQCLVAVDFDIFSIKIRENVSMTCCYWSWHFQYTSKWECIDDSVLLLLIMTSSVHMCVKMYRWLVAIDLGILSTQIRENALMTVFLLLLIVISSVHKYMRMYKWYCLAAIDLGIFSTQIRESVVAMTVSCCCWSWHLQYTNAQECIDYLLLLILTSSVHKYVRMYWWQCLVAVDIGRWGYTNYSVLVPLILASSLILI